jgi:heme-degrading monooxygenase HmoA
MFMASNQFRVMHGRELAFEDAWSEASARLQSASGLIGFRCDRGKELEEHVLYFVVTIWESELCFLEWKRVELYDGVRARKRQLSSLEAFQPGPSTSKAH